MKILVVEADQIVAQTVRTVMNQQNHVVEVATNGATGLALATTLDYDLLVVDVQLPKLDGISLCQQLRTQGYGQPLLLLAGQGNTFEPAIGLTAGADDYAFYPFDPAIFVAQTQVLLQSRRQNQFPLSIWSDLHLDCRQCQVTYEQQQVLLTPKECALLELFLSNSRRVFSCAAILDHLWGDTELPTEEVVRTHIKGLRQKLTAAGVEPDLIETVYGIGYRLKLLAPAADREPPSLKAPTIVKPTRQQTLAAIAAVWHRFKDRTIAQVNLIEQATLALIAETLTAELLQQARRNAHTLSGSLGTLGFPEGSRLAKQIELGLGHQDTLTADAAHQLYDLTRQLRQVIDQPTPSDTEPQGQEKPLLLVVDRDQALAESLIKEAESWGLRGAIAGDLEAAHEHLSHHPPSIVLLDLEFSDQIKDGITLLTELHHHTPPVPVVVFTADNSLARRLQVLRQGGQVFLQKPLPSAHVLEKVNEVLQPTDLTEARILVVDDDIRILSLLKNLLEPWGLQVTTLEDPRTFWETLESCTPDLVILDVEMPHLTGIDLCQVVRNDARWHSLPVLFLTAHTGSDMVNRVFASGADDFVNKPIVGPELVTRILNRLERIKLLRQMAETDPLTRVANRHKSTQDLEAFLRLAQRHQQPLCLAVLDLDNFKQVNDRYGHAMGDVVLRHMGDLLSQGLRREDVVARWGGEEFVVGQYGIDQRASVKRLTELLQTLHQHVFVTPDQQKFKVTFSAGVAEFPLHGDDLINLYRSADAALYRAKQSGRDRVMAS
jgi:diguanylate cyclase (GGDEF)-like protein